MRDTGGELTERGQLLLSAPDGPVWMRKSSSDFASSRVRASTLSNRRTFSIAIAAWSANVELTRSAFGERTHFRARQTQHADRDALAQHRHGENRAVIAQSLPFQEVYSGSAITSGI